MTVEYLLEETDDPSPLKSAVDETYIAAFEGLNEDERKEMLKYAEFLKSKRER